MGIISDAQLIGKALQEAGRIELYEKLIAIQEDIIKTAEENQSIRKEVLRLEELLKVKSSLFFDKNAYYGRDENGKIMDGPFCSGCFDKDGKAIRLHTTSNRLVYKCPVCGRFNGPVMGAL